VTLNAVRQVRTRAVAVLRRHGRAGEILVTGGHNDRTNEDYFRPLAAEVAQGEHAGETLRRVIHSTTGSDVANLSLLGSLEATHHGLAGWVNEVTFVYQGDLVDIALHNLDDVPLSTGATGTWQRLEAFRDDDATLLPDGLLELIDRQS
jgi:hypothetical protein